MKTKKNWLKPYFINLSSKYILSGTAMSYPEKYGDCIFTSMQTCVKTSQLGNFSSASSYGADGVSCVNNNTIAQVCS